MRPSSRRGTPRSSPTIRGGVWDSSKSATVWNADLESATHVGAGQWSLEVAVPWADLGATPIRAFWRITVPLLAPTHLFLAVIGVIWGFQTFDTVYLMTGGGPAGATEPVLLYLYRHAFNWFEMGYASAIAWVLFVLMMAATLVQWRLAGARAHAAEGGAT